jgi:hypothetical protein
MWLLWAANATAPKQSCRVQCGQSQRARPPWDGGLQERHWMVPQFCAGSVGRCQALLHSVSINLVLPVNLGDRAMLK